VHEGGYEIEDDGTGGLRFRNRHGVLCPTVPPRPPPGSVGQLVALSTRFGVTIDESTNHGGHGDVFDLELAVGVVGHAVGW
jgi:hypothetical protein